MSVLLTGWYFSLCDRLQILVPSTHLQSPDAGAPLPNLPPAIVGVWLKPFFLFYFFQHKPTAPNDLRDPTKTKDSLHPTGWMGPEAAGGEFDHWLQILALRRGNSSWCWRRCETDGFDKLSISMKLWWRGWVWRGWRSAGVDKHRQGLHKALDLWWSCNPSHNFL